MKGITWKPRNMSEIKQYCSLIPPHKTKSDDVEGAVDAWNQLQTHTLRRNFITLWCWSPDVKTPAFNELHKHFNYYYDKCVRNELNHITIPYSEVPSESSHRGMMPLFLSFLELKLRGATVEIDTPTDSEFKCMSEVLKQLLIHAPQYKSLITPLPLYQHQRRYLNYVVSTNPREVVDWEV